MTTVAIDDETRHALGELNNGNESLGQTVTRLIIDEFKRKGLKVPAALKH